MSQRTKFLGQLIGLYEILVSLSIFTHKQATVQTVTLMIHNPPVLFLAGVITVFAGLAMVLGHNVWSGGALPVIVTLIGWTSLIKGILLLFLSPDAASGVFLGALHYEQFFYGYSAFALFLGIYLTCAASRCRKV